MSGVEDNRRQWGQEHPWPEDGDEWRNQAEAFGQDYAAWKAALIGTMIAPYVSASTTALEIGCGHGRWSEHLMSASKVYLADVAPSCIDYCRKRFGDRATLIETPGPLPQIPEGSVDFIWSFDVFVHIDAREFQQYLGEFARVLSPGGLAIVHHADDHRFGGWRSEVSASDVRHWAHQRALVVTSQRDCWGPKGVYGVRLHRDAISWIERA